MDQVCADFDGTLECPACVSGFTHLLTPCTFMYVASSSRLLALPPSFGLARGPGRVVRGPRGLASESVVTTASFPLINLPTLP